MTPAREFKTPTICDSDGEIIWQAHPGFQTDLVNCPFPNVVLPGGRGSGKTDGCISKMLMHCLLYGEYANAKFFRVMKTDAEDLALRVDKVVGPLCGRNKSVRAMRWEISNGATMSISYLNERSLTSVQQGANTTMQCFDETTKYVDPRPIDMVLGSLRSTAPHVRTQRLLAANPWSEGHGWFYKRYVQRAGWYEPFQVPLDPEVQELLPDDFDEDGDLSIMLPSTVLDNPNTNNADFRRRLLRVGTVEQVLAWLTNDWSINFGAYFGRTFNESVHVIKEDDMFAPSKGWRHIRVMDWGFHDPACVLYVAVDPRGNAFIYDELYFSRKGSRTRGAEMTAPEVAEAIVRHERGKRPHSRRVQGEHRRHAGERRRLGQHDTGGSRERGHPLAAPEKNGAELSGDDAGGGRLAADEVVRPVAESRAFHFRTLRAHCRSGEKHPAKNDGRARGGSKLRRPRFGLRSDGVRLRVGEPEKNRRLPRGARRPPPARVREQQRRLCRAVRGLGGI